MSTESENYDRVISLHYSENIGKRYIARAFELTESQAGNILHRYRGGRGKAKTALEKFPNKSPQEILNSEIKKKAYSFLLGSYLGDGHLAKLGGSELALTS